MCRKQLPSIQKRLERIIDDIGPQEIIPEASEFFLDPNSKSKYFGSIVENSDDTSSESEDFFNQPDESNTFNRPIKKFTSQRKFPTVGPL